MRRALDDWHRAPYSGGRRYSIALAREKAQATGKKRLRAIASRPVGPRLELLDFRA
jgi:hypothetical protein